MNLYGRVALFSTILAMLVIVLGAYTRLKDAGLGCPDWPGCYGHFSVPKTSTEIDQARQRFPNQSIESKKAWLEMIHRYFAGILGLCVFVLTVGAFVKRWRDPAQPILVPILLSSLVIFQAALGMWTVTLSLLPLVVVGHLLGGVFIAGLLWVLTLSSLSAPSNGEPLQSPTASSRPGMPGSIAREGTINSRIVSEERLPSISGRDDGLFNRNDNIPHWKALKIVVILGLILMICQIFLGGWVSANYAALICPDFPGCHGSWFPALKLREAFNMMSPIGISYEGGVLDHAARATIQMVHRYGALFTLLYNGGLALYCMMAQSLKLLRKIGCFLFLLLWVQVFLGLFNILFMLPIPIALAHNLVAVLLFQSLVTLLYRLHRSGGVVSTS